MMKMLKALMTTAAMVAVAAPGFAQSANSDEMRNLTSNVLAGISGKAPEPAATGETAETDTGALKTLVEQAISEGQSDDYLEALINEAADTGQIEVPDAMRTTEGEVDTKTLLASLVTKSLNEGEEDAASDEEITEDRYYVVVSGDSLAAIALVYYDSAQAYTRIFDANRDQIRSPDRIVIGQRLLIPR